MHVICLTFGSCKIYLTIDMLLILRYNILIISLKILSASIITIIQTLSCIFNLKPFIECIVIKVLKHSMISNMHFLFPFLAHFHPKSNDWHLHMHYTLLMFLFSACPHNLVLFPHAHLFYYFHCSVDAVVINSFAKFPFPPLLGKDAFVVSTGC